MRRGGGGTGFRWRRCRTDPYDQRAADRCRGSGVASSGTGGDVLYPSGQRRLRLASAGATAWCAGSIFWNPYAVTILSNRRRVAPFGLAGGKTGQTGCNAVERACGVGGKNCPAPLVSPLRLVMWSRWQCPEAGGGGMARQDDGGIRHLQRAGVSWLFIGIRDSPGEEERHEFVTQRAKTSCWWPYRRRARWSNWCVTGSTVLTRAQVMEDGRRPRDGPRSPGGSYFP